MKVKRYKYVFEDEELPQIMAEVFQHTGFFPKGGEKSQHHIAITFEEELPPASVDALKQLIETRLPRFRFKETKQVLVAVNIEPEVKDSAN